MPVSRSIWCVGWAALIVGCGPGNGAGGPSVGNASDSGVRPPANGIPPSCLNANLADDAGTSLTSQTDEFTGPQPALVDVLWVVDQDSDSMGPKIAALAANAQAFMQAALLAQADFHVGVISLYVAGDLYTNCMTQSCTSFSSFGGVTIEPGVLYHGPGAPAWVSATDADPVGTFADNISIGITAAVTSREAGIDATHVALSAPDITGPNAGFLRSGARLVVIVVSDDDDTASVMTPAELVAFLKSLKPDDPDNVQFDAVSGDLPKGCTNGVDGDAPVFYDQVVQATGGHLYSICTGNYENIAASAGLDTFGQVTFVLSRPCDPETLQVTVSGEAILQGPDYTFNASTNSIALTAAPPIDTSIVVTYHTLCP